MNRTLNPKTLMGRKKLPMFSVVPPVALLHMAHAMRYGAFEALRADGEHGYGPFNWREINIEYSTYLDAAERHLKAFHDGEDYATADSRVHHLGHTMATCGILLDAIECGTAIDDRPLIGRGTAVRVMDRLKTIHAVHLDTPAIPSAADIRLLADKIPAPPPTLDDVQALLKQVALPLPTLQYISGCIDDAVVRASEVGLPGVPRCHPADCDPDCPGPPAPECMKCGDTGLVTYAEDVDVEKSEPCTCTAGLLQVNIGMDVKELEPLKVERFCGGPEFCDCHRNSLKAGGTD